MRLPLAAVSIVALVVVVACGDDAEISPDPTESTAAASGVGGATSAAVTSTSTSSSSATTSAASTTSSSSSSSSSSGPGPDTSTGVGGEGGAPPATSSSSTTGAGGSNPEGGGFDDGSRIVARYALGADGSKMPIGLYDTRLASPCSYQTADDGQMRCLPLGVGSSGIGNLFADATCTRPVAPKPACASTFGLVASGGCGPATEIQVIEFGADVPTDPKTGESLTFAVFQDRGCAPSPRDDAYVEATVRSPADFVSATIQNGE